MERLPRITLVTPSFNQGEFLEETLHSVLAQGYPDLEYFVVDGGSSDQSVNVIERHAARLSWWVSEKDRGHADAVNKGMTRASGEVWGFLNSDDILLEGALLRVGRYFAEHPECAWLAGSTRFFAAEPLAPQTPHLTEFWRPAARLGVLDFLEGCPIPQPSVFWRHEVWRRAGPFSGEIPSLDYEYYLRLLTLGFRPAVSADVLSGFRLHARSLSVAHLDEGLELNHATAMRYVDRLYPNASECTFIRRHLDAVHGLKRIPTLCRLGRMDEARRSASRALRSCPGLLRRRWVWGSLARAFLPRALSGLLLNAYHRIRTTGLDPAATNERAYIQRMKEW